TPAASAHPAGPAGAAGAAGRAMSERVRDCSPTPIAAFWGTGQDLPAAPPIRRRTIAVCGGATVPNQCDYSLRVIVLRSALRDARRRALGQDAMSISGAGAYRGDIDGLRALAVLGVVLFHLSPTSLSGGYVGVDVFFVISGYLITAQIRDALAEGRFSFVDFYASRIRRLYPALLATMLLTLAFAYFTLFPVEMKRVAQAMLAAALYVPNIYFFAEADYFAEGAVRPLLHTWSLGVEEQFYLVFPALLVLLARFPSRVAGSAVAALALLSLAYAEHLVGYDASAAFYLSPTRFWEFSTGALLTFLPPSRTRPPLAAGQ